MNPSEATHSKTQGPMYGLGTAILTPFNAQGAVDFDALERFVRFQLDQGVHFLVPCGTTGETPTLSEEEQDEIVRRTMALAQGRVPVVAGCTHNSTAQLIARGKRLCKLGVSHVLSASPYYNKPTQEGIYRHFKALHEETGLQIMAYSIQGRTASNIAPQTVERLASEGIIFALKEASGNILQIQDICGRCGDALAVFSGDDAMTLPAMAVGCVGLVSVVSNVVPGPMRDWVESITERRYAHAQAALRKLAPLFRACFVESNPIPVKAGAEILGLMKAHYRLPIVAAADSTVSHMREVLAPFRNGEAQNGGSSNGN